MRYYFNLRDGQTFLDQEGSEHADLDGVKSEALRCSADMLKGLRGQHFWSGVPWHMWVTDRPNGGGNTVLELTFSASLAA